MVKNPTSFLRGHALIRFWQVALSCLLLGLGLAAHAASSLEVNQALTTNQYLSSANGHFRFYLQGDGNLVLRDWRTRQSLWSSGTHGRGGVRLKMQGDGNLVLRKSSGSAVWSSKTNGKGATQLVLREDGNLVLENRSGGTVWETKTGDGSAPGDGDNNGGGDNSGGGTTGAIKHLGTTQVWDSNGQGVKINRPSSKTGDLLVLVLHRTDDVLPYEVSGWKRVAECYKEDNGYDCLTIADCSSKSGGFCTRFKNKYNGRDLAQVVFHKTVGTNEPGSYTFNLNRDSSGHPGWAILTALRGANTTSPVRDWAYKGCDKNEDSLFPSVYGQKGDLLLLSQSFDDAVAKDKFGAPSGMSTFGYVSNSDEAGFLYGGTLSANGETGTRKTQGSGASSCKDALVSLTVKPR